MPIVTPNDGPQSLNMALLGPEVDIDFHDEKVSDTYSQCIWRAPNIPVNTVLF